MAAAGMFILKLGAAYALGHLFGGDGADVEGPRLDSLVVQESAYGKDIPKVYGSARLAGNVIWTNGLEEHKHKEETGGKGGGGGSYTSYTYTCSFAIGICEGEITGIRRIWADSKLIWDAGEPEGGEWGADKTWLEWISQEKDMGLDMLSIEDSIDVLSDNELFVGSDTQMPSSIIEAIEGVGNVPAYRNISYIVFENMLVTNFGNRIPNLEFEVVVAKSTEPVFITNEELSAVCHWGPIHIEPKVFYAGDYLIISNRKYHIDYEGGEWHGTYWDVFELTTGKKINRLVMPYDVYRSGEAVFMMGDQPYIFYMSTNNPYNSAIDPPYEALPFLGTNVLTGETITQRLAMDYIPGDGVGVGATYVGAIGYSSFYGGYIYVIHQNYPISDLKPYAWFAIYPFDPVTGVLKTSVPVKTYRYLESDYFRARQITIYNDKLICVELESGGRNIITTTFENLPEIESSFDLYDDYRNHYGATVFPKTGDIIFVCNDLEPVAGLGSYEEAYPYGLGVSDGFNNAVKMVDVYSTEDISLPTVVDDLFEEAGLESSEYDSSDLAGDTITGYVRDSTMTVISAFKSLLDVYQFDLVEFDWKIHTIKRGGDVQVDIPWNSLCAHEYGGNPPSPMKETLTPETELPVEMSAEYLNYDLDYQTGVEYARRSSDAVNTTHKEELKWPIVMGATQALQAVEVVFGVRWIRRQAFEMFISSEYMYLSPGDVITVNNAAYQIVIDGIQFSFPLLLKLDCFAEETGAYQSNSTSCTPYHTPQITPGDKAAVHSVILDLPSLSSVSTQAGIFVAAYSISGEFPGAQIWVSYDDGVSWSYAATINDQSIVGKVVDVMTTVLDSDSVAKVIDEGSVINVEVQSYGDSLSGISESTMLAGGNTIAVLCTDSWAEGQWEIVSFQNVSEQGDGTYNISNIVRGRCGTDYDDLDDSNDIKKLTDCHEANNQFVMLETNKLVFVPVPEDFWETDVLFKIVSAGQTVQSVSPQSVNISGNNIRPYCPSNVSAYYDSSNDLIISWQRRSRSRLGWGYSGTPLYETTEAYEVDVYDGGTVVRTLEATSETVTYENADQVTDFGSLQTSLKIAVYQLSDTVGRGFGRFVTLSLKTT